MDQFTDDQLLASFLATVAYLYILKETNKDNPLFHRPIVTASYAFVTKDIRWVKAHKEIISICWPEMIEASARDLFKREMSKSEWRGAQQVVQAYGIKSCLPLDLPSENTTIYFDHPDKYHYLKVYRDDFKSTSSFYQAFVLTQIKYDGVVDPDLDLNQYSYTRKIAFSQKLIKAAIDRISRGKSNMLDEIISLDDYPCVYRNSVLQKMLIQEPSWLIEEIFRTSQFYSNIDRFLYIIYQRIDLYDWIIPLIEEYLINHPEKRREMEKSLEYGYITGKYRQLIIKPDDRLKHKKLIIGGTKICFG